MPLSNFMTTTATTYRRPLPDATTGKRGNATIYLENVKITPVMLPSNARLFDARQAGGLDGTSVWNFETFTESHQHTKETVTITELPDIRQNDLITIDGIQYTVKRAAPEGITSSFGQTLNIYLDLDND